MGKDVWIRKFGLPGRRMGATATSILILVAFCGPHLSQAQGASEYQVKSAYLYNFAKLAAWPKQEAENGAEPFWIGVVGGDDEFLDVLAKTVQGKSVGNHRISVKRVTGDDEMKSCREVFVRASIGRKRTKATIAAGIPASVLLVGEDEDFLPQGGLINLFLQNGKIRFAVNHEALDKAGIRVGTELLQLAQEDESGRKPKPGAARQVRYSDTPEYPEIARRLKLQGTVHVEVDVRPDGTIKAVRIVGGHPMLAEAFSEAVRRWKYEPAPNETVEQVYYTFDH